MTNLCNYNTSNFVMQVFSRPTAGKARQAPDIPKIFNLTIAQTAIAGMPLKIKSSAVFFIIQKQLILLSLLHIPDKTQVKHPNACALPFTPANGAHPVKCH